MTLSHRNDNNNHSTSIWQYTFGNLHFGNILIPAADDFDLEYHKAQENFEYNHRTGQSISLKTK